MLRLALIGCDDRAEQYADVAPRLKGARFIAAADPDASRARRAADRLKASIAANGLDELLADHADQFDTVLIQAIDGDLSADCRRAADAGKHLLVESPLAASTQIADGLIEACRNGKVQLMAGQASRFAPAVQTVKSSLASGALGDPGLLRIHRWEPRVSGNSGTLLQRVIREIDLANWLFECPPTEVYAIARPTADPQGDDCDYMQIHLGFPGGGMALIDYASTIPASEDYFSLSMIGSTGAAYADDHHNMQLLYAGGQPSALKTGQGSGHLLAQLQEFVDAVEERREPAITGADGRLAVQVAEAAAASAVNRQAAHLKGGRYELV